jgi:A/G-specific adenine glycosylase
LLAVLRNSLHPVTAVELDASWQDDDQRVRALDSLLADGLVETVAGRYRLPM